MKIRNLRILTGILTIMIVVDALWTPIVLGMALAAPTAFQTLVTPIAASVDLAAIVFKIATMIVFCGWIYMAGKNLVAAGFEDLEFTPAARIWWFAIPIAGLFKPFQGMRELWNASRGVYPYETNESLVATWWALWLASNIAGLVLNNARGSDDVVLWVTGALDMGLAAVAIVMIRGIAQAQRRLDGSDLSEVFA